MLSRARALVPAETMLELAESANLDRDPAVKRAILAAAVAGDERLASKIVQILQPEATRQLLQQIPFKPPMPADLLPVDDRRYLLLGEAERIEVPVPYPLSLLVQHGCNIGASGSGKSNFLTSTFLQTMRHGIPVWIFDRDKQDYRHLYRVNPEIMVLDAVDHFIVNPLEVHAPIGPKQHLIMFVTIFCKTNNLLDGAEALLLKAVNELYLERGIFDGGTDYPTLVDLLEKLKGYVIKGGSRPAGFRDSIITRLESYLLTSPRTYSFRRGFPIDKLAEMTFVLEVKGLSERHARFLMTFLLYLLFLYRIATNQRGTGLRNLVGIDEGAWAAPPGYNDNIGQPPLASILSMARETGIGILFANQSLHVNESIFVNSRLKMVMRLGSGNDIDRARKMMALSKEQADYIPKLDVGQAIVRIPKVDPFLIRTPRIPLE